MRSLDTVINKYEWVDRLGWQKRWILDTFLAHLGVLSDYKMRKLFSSREMRNAFHDLVRHGWIHKVDARNLDEDVQYLAITAVVGGPRARKFWVLDQDLEILLRDILTF